MSERRDGRGGGGGHQWRFDHEAACTTENVVVSVPQALSCEGSKPESVPGRRLPSPLISDGELEFNPDPAIIRHLPPHATFLLHATTEGTTCYQTGNTTFVPPSTQTARIEQPESSPAETQATHRAKLPLPPAGLSNPYR